jgi:hypothetical protein
MSHAFLNFVSEEYLQRGRNWTNTQRSAYLFKRVLKDKISSPAILPSIITADEWLQQNQDKTTQKSALLLWELYLVFKEVMEENVSWIQFLKWGSPLLSDFSEIDGNLVDAKRLFRQLEEEKKLEAWAKRLGDIPLEEDALARQQSYVEFFGKLADVYQRFKESVGRKKWGTKGDLLRNWSETVIKFDREIWMVGFSAISKAEEVIWNQLALQNKLQAFFHLEPWMLQAEQESGLFFRKQHVNKEWWNLKNHFGEFGKQIIEINSTIDSIHQVKVAVQQIEALLKDKKCQPNELGVILCDESLLVPFLDSLPPNSFEVNVSMGFPVSESLIFAAIKRLEWYFLRMESRNQTAFISEIQSVLTTGAWKLLIPNESMNCLKFWRKRGAQRMQKTQWTEWKEKMNLHWASTWFEKTPPSWENLSEHLIVICSHWKQKFPPTHREHRSAQFLETALQEIHFFCSETQQQLLWSEGLKWLISEWGKERIPLEGDRNDGIQVMGILESRSLDFKHLLVLSANEGILPSAHQPHYFIPLRVKISNRMRDRKEESAVAAYLFYRAISTPESVYLYYATASDYAQGGEKSRFVEQILNERIALRPQTQIQSIQHRFPSEMPMSQLKKEPLVLEKLKTYFEVKLPNWEAGKNENGKLVGISPSFISSYKNYPFDFFLQRFLGFSEEEKDVTDHLDARLVGVLFHEAVDFLYQPINHGGDLTTEHLAWMRENIEVALKHGLSVQDLEYRPTSHGRNHLLVNLARIYLEQWIGFEDKRMSSKKVLILGIEEEFVHPVELEIWGEKKKVHLLGKFDRIETENGVLRIVDYKSGSFKDKDLKISPRQFEVIDPELPISSKAYQLMFYAYVLLQQNDFQSISSIELAIAPLQKIVGKPLAFLEVKMDKSDIRKYVTREQLEMFFENVVKVELQQVFDMEHPMEVPVEKIGSGILPA